MSLRVVKNENETWREAVERIAKVYGLEEECLYEYDRLRARNVIEAQAAWEALYEWDCLEFVPDKEGD